MLSSDFVYVSHRFLSYRHSLPDRNSMAGKGALREEVLDFENSEGVDVTPTFDSMGLREDLLRGIYGYGEGGERERVREG